MKRTLNTHEIADELYRDEYANWSWAGAVALAEYLEECDNDSGEDSELDIVDIRCNFSEYSSAVDAAVEYGWDDTTEEAGALEWLQDRTLVICFDGGVIIRDY
jgi:hypothetical protein